MCELLPRLAGIVGRSVLLVFRTAAVASRYAGDEVYLVPNRPSAPSAAYRQPKVTIKWVSATRAVVILPDGREIETDRRNLADEPRQDPQTKNLKIRPAMPDGYKEQLLW